MGSSDTVLRWLQAHALCKNTLVNNSSLDPALPKCKSVLTSFKTDLDNSQVTSDLLVARGCMERGSLVQLQSATLWGMEHLQAASHSAVSLSTK